VTSGPPVVKRLDDVQPKLISPDDTVRLATLVRPADGTRASVFYEIWEPEGTQPPNSHPDSAEIFIVLSGHAQAFSDEHRVDLGPGDVLLLPAGSVHRIVNASPTERLYTVTIMDRDAGALPGGFAALVDRGAPAAWDEADRAILGQR
jgi:mannose-6-phosphate isomerase-like protein (cupin superfamily)